MKYGETLQQRSIPLWETYNVDYNDIKHLIKVRTTHGQGQAKAIPGNNNEAKQLQEFEEELYGELREQYQRINLFVQSKAGEITRRLSHLDKQIAQLEIRSFATGQSKISIKRLEKFAKAEAAILKAGEEIQSLSRFVGAQRLAFQKLLKKYKKWTASSDLGKRFREEVLDRPTSFSKMNFEPLLSQWTEVLASVRAPFEGGANWSPDFSKARQGITKYGMADHKRSPDGSTEEASGQSSRGSSSAADLQSTWESGSNVDIDTALAVLPLGRGAAKAVYWVHPDNIVPIHVFLLQYTRLQKPNDFGTSADTPPSSRSSPRNSISAHANRPAPRKDEEIGLIVCDDLQRFAKRRNSENISDAEDRPGTVSEKAAASIRYCCNGEAVVVVGTVLENANESAKPSKRQLPNQAKLERKVISRLFDTSKADRTTKEQDSKDSNVVSRWLADNREVQPLVQLQSRRTRFVGLKNSSISGIWATLDKDVLMRPCSQDLIAGGKNMGTISEGGEHGSTPFPHAILEVRIEGDTGADLVTGLDCSYLTERVRGFSLETHAVATLCKPYGMPRPFWLPALGQDIRKVPAATKVTKGRALLGGLSPEESSTRHTSISASSTTNGPSGSGFSAPMGESSATSAPDAVAPPPLSAFKKKRRQSHRKRILRKGLSEPSQSRRTRYWNEFDDGSEGSGNEAYTIFVDPNASYGFPGAATISKLVNALTSNFNAAEQKVASWIRPSHEPKFREHEPLLNGEHSPSFDDSDASDEESSTRHVRSASRRHYSTFSGLPQPPAIRARETLLFRSCLVSYIASFVLLIVAAILKTTGRRKAQTTVDAGVVIGVATSLVSAIIAVGSMIARKDKLGWLHRAIVSLIFVIVILGSVGLLIALGHS